MEGLIDGSPNPADSPPQSAFIYLPRLNVQASAGAGLVVQSEQVAQQIAFRRDWVKDHLQATPEDLVLIEAAGDSMTPTIASGDMLLVDKSIQRLRNGAVYILSVGDDLLVKRVIRHATGSITIRSDNAAYPPETFTEGEAVNIRIVGQVVWRGGPP